jgi:Putative addiction module component
MVTGKVEKIRAETESLSDSEKIALADILLSSTGMTVETDALWREELKKRSQRIQTGQLKTISLEEFRAKHETDQTFRRG